MDKKAEERNITMFFAKNIFGWSEFIIKITPMRNLKQNRTRDLLDLLTISYHGTLTALTFPGGDNYSKFVISTVIAYNTAVSTKREARFLEHFA